MKNENLSIGGTTYTQPIIGEKYLFIFNVKKTKKKKRTLQIG